MWPVVEVEVLKCECDGHGGQITQSRTIISMELVWNCRKSRIQIETTQYHVNPKTKHWNKNLVLITQFMLFM